MNRPKATRLRLFLVVAAVAAFAVFVPASANADFTAGSGPTGTTGVAVQFSDTTPGAHSDITVTHTYNYDGVPAGGPANTGDDLKQWILDTPAGFYGNPSAVPFAERCTQDQMNSYVPGAPKPGVASTPGSQCPATSQVGTAVLTLGVDADDSIGAALNGKIFVVQSANPLQEVPTTLFTVFETGSAAIPCATCITASTSRTQIAPVTSGPQGDYRLRSVSEGPINRPDLTAAYNAAHATSFPANTFPGNIKGIQQVLWGDLSTHGTGVNATGPFQTNPNTCTDWTSTLYASSYGNKGTPPSGSVVVGTASQTNTLSGTANPGGGDSSGSYAKWDAAPTTPTNCDQAKALTQNTTAAVSGSARDGYPGLTVTVDNPDSMNVDRAKKLVTTLPASISVNINALNNLCSDSDLQADTCPAATQVGTAQINSPILSATQQGRVYATKGSTPGLPYLSIWVDGAFKFRLDATTKFVGPSVNQIETTFDNLPPLPFDKFVVNITGGSSSSSLLNTRSCPTDGSSPQDGPITFATTGDAGGTKASSSATSFDPCYGVSNPSKVSKCVKVSKKLSVSPKGLVATSTIANVQLLTGSKSSKLKSRAKDSGSPFKFKYTLKKKDYKKNKKYYYGYKVTYKDGHVIKTKSATFKTCK